MQSLLKTIKEWPKDIYEIPAVIVAVQSALDKIDSSPTNAAAAHASVILMECLVELLVTDAHSLLLLLTPLTADTLLIINRAKLSLTFSDSVARMFSISFESTIFLQTYKIRRYCWYSSIMSLWRSEKTRNHVAAQLQTEGPLL